MVYNILEHEFTETTAISKGFNFTITLRQIPKEEIITDVKTASDEIEDNKVERIRQEVSRNFPQEPTTATKFDKRCVISSKKFVKYRKSY